MKKIALITGSNKGIGFEIARQLAKNEFRVIVTGRDTEKAEKAAQELAGEGCDALAIQLDVTDIASIGKAAAFVKEQGGLDVLVNNAGILLDMEESVLNPDFAKIKKTIETNTYGPIMVINGMLPELKEHARIINLSSGMGALSSMDNYFAPGYRLSKTALNAVTKMFAAALEEKKISVNSMCPGWVKTDMGGSSAPRSTEQGADTALWLATVETSPTGKFFRDREEIDW